MLRLVAAILLLVCVLAALVVALSPARTSSLSHGTTVSGGGRLSPPDKAHSAHLIVDTLNLVHWLGLASAKPGAPGAPGGLTPEVIAEAIDRTAAALKARHPGRVVYVLKDRESTLNTDASRDVYRAAAERNGVYVVVAERYDAAAAPRDGTTAATRAEHSARGRDDFLTALLAARYRCAVLTEDRLRDFDRFRATIAPFHTLEYAFWRAAPAREYVRPDAAAYARLRKPRCVRPADYFGKDFTAIGKKAHVA